MKKRIVRSAAAALLAVLLCAGGLCACKTLHDLPEIPWPEESVTEEVNTDNMIIHVTGDDHAPEKEPVVPGSTPYTGDVHVGTDIYYVGSGENRDYIIAIDPGHQVRGNSDKEPVGPGSDQTQAKVSYGTTGTYTGDYEFDLNLKVAIVLRDELIRRGYSVVMIRETNQVDVSNVERAQIANRHNASALIRIHANGWTDETTNGAMTVCQTEKNPYPDCAAVYKESRLLSECILEAYCASTGMARYSLWETDTKAGTNWSKVPSTILEMGFMTNRGDDEKMATLQFKVDAARGIADGLDTYFARLAAEKQQ